MTLLQASFWKKNSGIILACVALVVISVCMYGKTLSFDFVNWDDDLYVYQNADIRAFSPENIKNWFTRSYVAIYVPIPMFSYALDYLIHGLNPSGYHLTNLAIHTLNSLIVLLIFFSFNKDILISFLAAVLFLIHPVQVETVAWISQRKNLLFAFFFLAGFYVRVRALGSERYRTRWLMLSMMLFVMSVLSKATAVVIPLVLIAYEYFYRGARRREGGLIALFLIVPVLAMGAFTFTLYPDLISRFDAAVITNALLRCFAYLMHYLRLIFFPFDLHIQYISVFQEWLKMPGLAVVISACLMFAAVLYLKKKNRAYGFWFLWFLIFLLPVVNIFYVPTADRHLYMPLIGLLGLVAVCMNSLRALRLGLIAAAIVMLWPVSNQRLDLWQNPETFWTKSIREWDAEAPGRRPFSYTMRMHLAGHYEDLGQIDRAIENYWPIARERYHLPYAYFNLYGLLKMKGDQAGMAELSRLFNENYVRTYELPALYNQLVARKSNPEAVKEILKNVMDDFNERMIRA